MKEKTFCKSFLQILKIGTAVVIGLAVISCTAKDASVYKAGTYSASADGISSTVTVTMTFSKTGITDVRIDASGETPDIGGTAADTLKKQLLDKQTAEIDGVSGATITSTAVKKAAAICIAQAKKTDSVSLNGSNNNVSTEAAWRKTPAEISDSKIKQTYEVDIGIIGLGHSGLAVFRAAAEHNANVLAVEKQAEGTWWTIGHDIGCINSKHQQKFGIQNIDPIDFLNNWELMANNKANPYFVMQFAKHSGEAIDWYMEPVDQGLIDQMRMTFWPDNKYTVHKLSNGYKYYSGAMEIWTDIWKARESGKPFDPNELNNTSGLELKDMSRMNLKYVTKNYHNAKVLWQTTGAQLVKKDGKVTGFIAKTADGSYVKVNCRKGVVLAGGGFGGNIEMCNDLLPAVKRMYTPDEKFTAQFDRDGSTIAMGVWAGGRLEGEISTMNFDSIYLPDMVPGPFIVDSTGSRFQNEASAGTEMNGMFVCRSRRGPVYAVYDKNYKKQILTGFPSHSGFDYSDKYEVQRMDNTFAAAKAAGTKGTDSGWFCADTLEELADALGFTGETKATFLAQVAEYNKICKSGVDTDFGKDPHFLNALTTGPYYAHKCELTAGFGLVTTGGFVTTNQQNVVDDYYNPIPGLYATGNNCGLRFGPTYITPIPGVSVGMAITLGKELGEYLSK